MSFARDWSSDVCSSDLKDFIDDPETNPLPSGSGKFEIHCQALADKIEAVGLETIRTFPLYKRPAEGYEDTLVDGERTITGETALQLLTVHVPTRDQAN